MLRGFRIPCLVLGLLLWPCGGRALWAQELVPDAGTQLLLHVNNNTTGSAGETPVLEAGVEFASGRFETGATLSSGDRLRYTADGNITATAGTVETWIKPVWSGNDGQGHTILSWGGGGGMVILKDSAGNLRIILNRYGAGGQLEQGVAFSINSWVSGQWHHVAFSWNASMMRVYIDGAQRAQNPVSITLPAISESAFEIGSDDGGGSVAATLDELRISDYARSAEEVAMAFGSAGYSTAELPGAVDTQLLLHFNNHTTGLAGETPSTSLGVSYSTGRYSQGASLSTADRLTYNAFGNITATSGTVEGWYKPEWSGNDGQNHLILTWGPSGGLLIGKDASDNLRLMLNRYSAYGLPEQGTALNIGNWLADQWHHLAFTWDAAAMRIYIDGQLAAEAPVTITLPAISTSIFQIGGEGTGSSLRAVVDEFRISSRARTAAEIAQTFMGGLLVTALTASPDTLLLEPTLTAALTLTAETDLGPFEIPALVATWSSSNPAVASVTPEGLVTAQSAGTATVSATYRGFTASVDVTVASALVDRWAMQQRDQEHTGRASFVIPASRQNDQLFETCRWQTPLPGPVGGSSPLFTQTSGETAGRVALGYHWPKGIQVMNRATGVVDWASNPGGGETIGEYTGALSADNGWIYVTNDATETPEWPGGTPVMALDMLNGNLRAHSGGATDPALVTRPALTLGDDDRVYAHGWGVGPAALSDQGSELTLSWVPWSVAGHYANGAALSWWEGSLRVVTGNEGGSVECWSAATEELLWSASAGVPLLTTTTVDPATGRSYLPAGSGSVGVVGLGPDGQALWGAVYQELHTWNGVPGAEQRAQAGGTLSHDGATFYFQTMAPDGSGALYAVNTSDGSLKWSLPTGSTGWDKVSSCPLVTPNGILILGNNWDRWLAVRDNGADGEVLDQLLSEPETATASPALTEDGLLYLCARTLWTLPNGLQMPDYQTHDLLAAVDLSESPWTVTPACQPINPTQLSAVAGDARVTLHWNWPPMAESCFSHYAIYRGTEPFSDVSGMTPVAEQPGMLAVGWTDVDLPNDVAFWYAVVSVDIDGQFDPRVSATGPRTPHWRNDLQVACIRRDTQFPRYAPVYSTYEITEPNGFGPYTVSAATSLDQGQTCEDPHQPTVGDPVTWTAVVRNAGTTHWEGELPWVWWVDDLLQTEGQRFVSLAPGDTVMFTHTRTWDENGHRLQFSIYPWDDRGENNDLAQEAWSVPFKTYVDQGKLEDFRELTPGFPGARTNDMLDWLQQHMRRFNDLFEAAGVDKRVHYDLLQVLDDAVPDPVLPPDNLFGIFPYRYREGEGDTRLSAYYVPDDDIDYGLLHELAHQLGLIDVYQLDVPAEANQVSGLAYRAHEDLMHSCSPWLNRQSALGMQHWNRAGHGYYGQYVYGMPAQLSMRFLDQQGNPLANAQVEVYQYCERPGLGKVITDQVKFSGTTDMNGLFPLPNVDVDESLAPQTCLGDGLSDNPFGVVAVVGTNGVLHFKVSLGGRSEYAWLDISEANVAYYEGNTESAEFERRLLLGGEEDFFLDLDLCENSAGSWGISTNGTNSMTNDTEAFHNGLNSVRAQTDGDYITLIYPGNQLGRYDISQCDSLVGWTLVENDQEFQLNAPWVRLNSADGYVEYQPAADQLSHGIGQWYRLAIPLAGDEFWQRADSGMPDFSRVISVQFFADTWDYGFSWWLDGLHFTPACCATDCNGNGLRDCDDIATGISQDVNGNQVPDECECGGGIPAPGLVASLEGGELRLSWTAVTHDLLGCPLDNPLYHLWQADESAGPWTELLSTGELSCLQPLDGPRGFYRVSVTAGPTNVTRVSREAAKPANARSQPSQAR